MIAVLGTVGAALALLAYAGIARGWWQSTDLVYHGVNVAAGGLLLINALSVGAVAFVLLNLAWLGVGAHKIFQGVAQSGRARGSGPRGRRFKSSLPDLAGEHRDESSQRPPGLRRNAGSDGA